MSTHASNALHLATLHGIDLLSKKLAGENFPDSVKNTIKHRAQKVMEEEKAKYLHGPVTFTEKLTGGTTWRL